MKLLQWGLAMACLLILGVSNVQAQYFGRNKPNYENFDFKVYQTPNFEIYHYLKNKDVLDRLANDAEQWYLLHQNVLKDTIKQRNPLLFYNNHADFQQTNTISGAIGVGTGGVTEAFKNRVVMPLAMSNQQTHHVLGHEMVHAFQYNMIIRGDSTSLQNLGNLPLWMVEGLAEYMSIGRVDPHTAMWMRDAVINDDIPSLKDLNNYGKYFPYRYGQVFWSFLTGLMGDEIIEPFFLGVARDGFDRTSIRLLGMKEKDLSKLWEDSFKKYFSTYLTDEQTGVVGKAVITDENGGKLNISPEISPNGRYVIFLSEKDLFSTDLFLADVRTGKIIRKVASANRDGHIDDFSYIESSGTWSPNSREFAFVGVSKGDNILIIKDVESGKTVKEVRLKEVPAFSNPAWSPDGDQIVITGLVDGQVDLYSYNVKTNKVTQLTNDQYSEMHPSWSADGQRLIYSTDALSQQRGRTDGKWHFNIAALDVASKSVTNYEVFTGADNLNPVEDPDGNIIFLSNRDGFRNLYRLEPASGQVYQLTNLKTGVSGITHFAPAISIDRKRNRLLYTYFSDGSYQIFVARPEDFINKSVDPAAVDMAPAKLITLNKQAPLLVNKQLEQIDRIEDIPESEFTQVDYKPKFKLDYIGGGAGVGVGTSNTFGTTTGAAGGVDALFSDILGNNQFFTSLSLNGEITDFGGAAAYVNRNHRITYGASLSHLPYRSFFLGNSGLDDLEIGDENYQVIADTFFIRRLFEQKASVFAAYPISTTMRFEANASASRYSSRVDQYVNYYQPFAVGGGQYVRGNYINQDREKVDGGDGFGLFTVGAAMVGDNASFGLTAPLNGQRYRLGFDRYLGEFNFTGVTADYRKYQFLKPVSLAFRAMHYGRYGGNSEDLYPLYLGSPWYIRGLNSQNAVDIFARNNRSFDELVGSKIFVTNFEVRMPFTGPEQIALIKSGLFLSDFNLFVDAGVAWYDFDQFKGSGELPGRFVNAKPIVTTGASLRVNLFGALVIEPYLARPLLTDSKWVFGVNFVPGW